MSIHAFDSWEESHSPEKAGKSSSDVTKGISLFRTSILDIAKEHEIHHNHKDNQEEQNASSLFELLVTTHGVPVDDNHGQETGNNAIDGG